MIYISEKSKCCGCAACVQRCPRQCISMKEDCQGFYYPVVDQDLCVECHQCEDVCPILNQSRLQSPKSVYAAYNHNEFIRLKSSSGGVFSLLANKVLVLEGVVFGARFDEKWNVVHDYTESVDNLYRFRGSKYLQSEIRNCFVLAKHFLDDKRYVLFSGTPCQIAGLRRFLNKDYEKLLLVQVACHGVPSPLVWQSYLKQRIYKRGGISDI